MESPSIPGFDGWNMMEVATMNRLRDYLVNELRKLSIADRIFAIVVALAILTTLLLVMAIQSVRLQTAYRNQLATSATAALNIERVNGLIYAIVMESRGIYMSTDRAKVKVYADAILSRNRDLAKVVSEWQGTIHGEDAGQFADFKKRVDQFIDFRIELARRAVEVSPAAGREWGDNDANRAVRIALNDDLEAFAKIYAARASHVVELGDQTRLASWYLAALGIAVLMLAAFNVHVMKRFVVTPLAEITHATDSIAAGKTNIVIPYLTRSDEVGRLAHAVQNFRDTLCRNVELEELGLGTAKQRDKAMEERDTLNDKYYAAKWQLSAAVNNMPQGLVMLDAAARILVMNEQFRKLYDLPAHIKVGSSLRDILEFRIKTGQLDGTVAERLAVIMERIAKRQPSSTEMELGDGRVVRISERPMDGGGWVATHDDFTEERRMQRVLERTERFLVTVIENVPEAIAAKDANSLRYVFVNRAAEKLFNLPRASIMGKTARELFSTDHADMIERGDKRLLEGSEQREAVVHAVETPDGPRLHAVRRIPVRGPDGDSRVFLSMIEDRTEWAKAPIAVTLAA
jgi:PAS domain S-box-containing protein